MAADAPAPSNQAAKEILAGSFGGVCQVLTGQPFDTLKVRLQTQPHLYSGVSDCVRKTLAADGPKGFYKGTLTPLVGIGACVSIQFATLESVKRSFAPNGGDLSATQLYLAGAASGVANSVVSGPVEHIRTRLQVQTASAGGQLQYTGPLDAIRKIVKAHGIAGVYKGQAVTMAREFQGYGAYFLTYELLVQRACAVAQCKRADLPTWKVMLFGALSGYSMWISVYPIDIIKSKLQTDALAANERQFTSALDCARKIMAKEGAAGFFRGFAPCMLRAAPVNAFTFLGYEAAMNVLGRN